MFVRYILPQTPVLLNQIQVGKVLAKRRNWRTLRPKGGATPMFRNAAHFRLIRFNNLRAIRMRFNAATLRLRMLGQYAPNSEVQLALNLLKDFRDLEIDLEVV